MLKVRNLSNQFQKRLIRPKYAQTQATPYAAVLDPALRNTDGSFRPPVSADSTPVDYTANVFTIQGGLAPGTVVIKTQGDAVIPARGGDNADRPFGLLANFVGGTLDDIGDENYVGVWRGPDAVFEVLAPAFNDTGLAAAYAAATPGNPVPLVAGTDGRLVYESSLGNRIVVAHLIERVNSGKIVIDLRV